MIEQMNKQQLWQDSIKHANLYQKQHEKEDEEDDKDTYYDAKDAISLLKNRDMGMWLEEVHVGYSKFVTGFVEYGVDSVDDIFELDADDINEIIKLLSYTCGAKPFHIKKITSAIAKSQK